MCLFSIVNRQMVPGVIVMPGATNSDGFSGVKHESDCTNQTTAAIVNQLLNTGRLAGQKLYIFLLLGMVRYKD